MSAYEKECEELKKEVESLENDIHKRRQDNFLSILFMESIAQLKFLEMYKLSDKMVEKYRTFRKKHSVDDSIRLTLRWSTEKNKYLDKNLVNETIELALKSIQSDRAYMLGLLG